MRTMSLILAFLFLGTGAFLFGQEENFILGEIIDQNTEEPVVFASIRIKGKALGVISNSDGSFKIPLKYKTYGDTLVISSMGYESLALLIHDLSEDIEHTIKMKPGVLSLQEAVITARKKRGLSARQIVRRAIKAIPDNYPNDPFAMVGYYRDYQIDSVGYVNLNEAILEVFDQGFQTVDSTNTKVKIYEYTENLDFRRDSMALKSYDYKSAKSRKVIDQAFLSPHGGNEFRILRVHDALRNHEINSYSFVHKLKSDLLSEHKFSRDTDTYFDEGSLYTIKFSKLLLNYSAYGTLYISKNNFAIQGMEYSVYDRTKNRRDNLLNKNGNDNSLIFEVNIEYRENENKMYLNYISFQNTFRLWNPPKLVTDYIVPDFELKCFVIGFNGKIMLADAINLENYEVRVKGKTVLMQKAELLDSQNIVFLFPKMYPNKAEDMLREIDIAARKDKITNDLFEIKITNIRDADGNVINQWTSRDYNQFREFFPQEIKPNYSAPQDSLYMQNQKPIFQNQPIVRPDNFDQYWMNTPLKTINN